MRANWLKDRLTQAKANSPLWAAFADALQTIWGEEVEGTLTRISERKNFFTMDPEDVETRISEYGRFFTITEKDATRKPMLLTQRLDEVHFKGTDRPLEQTFWREFGEMPVTWEGLYAPVNLDAFPYGSVFITEADVAVSEAIYGEFFLTSRGMILINLNDLATRYGRMDKDEAVERLLKDFDRIVAPLLPLHIVFDGVTLRLVVEFKPEYTEELHQTRIEVVNKPLESFASAEDSVMLSSSAGIATEFTDLYQPKKALQISWDTMPVDAWLIDFDVLNQIKVIPSPEVTHLYLLPGETKRIHVTLTPESSKDAYFSAYEDDSSICNATFDDAYVTVTGKWLGNTTVQVISNTGNVELIYIDVMAGAKFDVTFNSYLAPIFYANEGAEFIVDWGDGVPGRDYVQYSPGKNGYIPSEHIYEENRSYTVTVYGSDSIAFGQSGTSTPINSISKVHMIAGARTKADYIFYNQNKLTLISNICLPNIISAISMAEGCSLLESLPDDFLTDETDIENLEGSFRLSGITSLPVGFLKKAAKIKSMYRTFAYCPLKTVESGMLNSCSSSLTTGAHMFFCCYELISDVNEIFSANSYNNITNSTSMFSNAINVTGRGMLLIEKMPNLKSHTNMFTKCTKLDDWVEIPTGWY